MIAPDRGQWKVIWLTLGATFVFWLFGQASDYNSEERLWNGVALFVLVAGILRVWMLEGRKTKPPDTGAPTA